MTENSIFKSFYLSFFSKDFYQDVAKNWKGKAFGSLFVVLALCWVPTLGKLHVTGMRILQDELSKITASIPPISIQNGEATVDVEMPYQISNPETGEIMLVIDTSGQINTLEEANARMLLTRTRFIYQQNVSQIRSFELNQINDLYIDQERLDGWINTFRKGFVFVAYPFALVFSYLYRLLQAAVYALIGLLFLKITNANLAYSDIYRLALVTISPVIVLSTAIGVLGIPIPGWPLLCLFIGLGYLYFGIKSNKEPTS